MALDAEERRKVERMGSSSLDLALVEEVVALEALLLQHQPRRQLELDKLELASDHPSLRRSRSYTELTTNSS